MTWRRQRRIGLFVIGVVVAGWAALHASSVGASWSSAWHLIDQLGWRWLAGLAALWFLGLCVHTVVLTASMPGLSHRRALTLNLSGSAVANVLPLGGVAGTVLNLGMVRGWGHSGPDFARFVVVSKAADLVAKLLTPALALAGLLLWGLIEPARHDVPWALGAAAGAVAGCLVVCALVGRVGPLLRLVTLAERGWTWRSRRSHRLGRSHRSGRSGRSGCSGCSGRSGRSGRSGCLGCSGRSNRSGRSGRSGRDPAPGWTAAVTRLLDGTDRLVRRRWASLTWGMAGYWVLQGALLWLCMVAVGVHVAAPVVFAGLVAERLLTLLALTPGGAGVVEAGAIAVLIALGVAPTGALAGILLYRAFVFLAEIPVGGIATLAWLISRRAVARRPA
ncbi:uncharacterized protein (TIRG00374 family) [Asanoa ferruginea]|uniref:Uncharacterized protein (TIRG00374 family) n=1 Tax=Asanoa ferruginea TaxID=53367 RepID=A0A3D9ZTX2_9ACTN|nr:YbhN family protein [Asanoa ferruginea]REG00837.1 uncharacterized protein (TIRG00374 family) [Asanoa ferruginea]GIF47288.1 hypothetical protein Afe04nite_18270 [Asanoa ferruginea]